MPLRQPIGGADLLSGLAIPPHLRQEARNHARAARRLLPVIVRRRAPPKTMYAALRALHPRAKRPMIARSRVGRLSDDLKRLPQQRRHLTHHSPPRRSRISSVFTVCIIFRSGIGLGVLWLLA
jgi:hypothetical protein